jgi:hypothetical protein
MPLRKVRILPLVEVLTGMQSGVSGLLDVARQTFKEATQDVHQHVTDINRTKAPLRHDGQINLLTFDRAISDDCRD